MTVLSGVRVAEIGGGHALAYCGKLFADFGAEVIKLEPPGGDPGRQIPPLVDVGGGRHEGGFFAWLNTNKRSVTDTPAARAAVVETVEVLLDGRLPAEREAAPLGLPGQIVVAFSPFGEDGPYRDYAATDSTLRALAGLAALTGPIAGPPLLLADFQTHLPGGLNGFIAALSGLYADDDAGRHFALSLFEANVVISEYQAAQAVGLGLHERRFGVNRFMPTFPLGNYSCREGVLGITVLTPDQWRNFCVLMGLQHIAEDPRFATAALRLECADELEALYVPKFQDRTAREWFEAGRKLNIPFVVVPDMAGLLAEPVHRGRGAFGTVRIGGARFAAPVLPQRLTVTPPAPNGTAPLAGADDATWQLSARPRGRHGVLGTEIGTGLPLAGLRVVDLSMGWAGPLATRQLADLGAEIIKVEGCAYPDWWRGTDYSPDSMATHLYEKRMWFNVLNRNKTGITLDLTRPEGADLLRRLVAGADAVIENYSQGVLPKLGLAYADLVKIKPDLVMVSMPAFGGGTAWRDVRAYGSTLEQGSGLPSVSGTPDLPPVMNHVAYGDPIGGMNAGAAALLALLHRKRTGQGQYVDLSQVECMFPLVAAWVIEQSVTGKVVRRGNRHPLYAPNGVFPCVGEDRWIAVSVTSDAGFAALCRVIGRADLAADPALATREGRVTQQDRLEAALAAWTATQDAETAMANLQTAGISAGVARWPGELMRSEPHLAARGHWQVVDRAWLGPHQQPSMPFRMNGARIPVRRPAPTLGQSTEAVLRDQLGLDEADLAALREARIIGTEAIAASDRKPRSAALARAAVQG